MKTQIMKVRNSFRIVLMASFILLTACQSKTSGQDSSESKKEVKQVKPKMDVNAAAFIGDLKAIKQHISIGSDLNVKDQFGSTPLIIATTFNKVEVAKALIEGGADLSLTSADGSTPLHTAAFFCRKDIVEMLIANGADKTIKNNYGSTPYESVISNFSDVKPIYIQLNKDLGPLGLKLDYDELENLRPVIAELVK